ncbi:aldo/keto reductase [Vibrio lentus]|nr:aldo/keto reductase [Vibrio lentus]
MTWGLQNTQQQADQQIEYSLSQGINFIDTAEMYAVHTAVSNTYGKTEAIIGNWLARNPQRLKEVVIASKIAGPGLPWVRDGGPITR